MTAKIVKQTAITSIKYKYFDNFFNIFTLSITSDTIPNGIRIIKEAIIVKNKALTPNILQNNNSVILSKVKLPK